MSKQNPEPRLGTSIDCDNPRPIEHGIGQLLCKALAGQCGQRRALWDRPQSPHRSRNPGNTDAVNHGAWRFRSASVVGGYPPHSPAIS